METAKVEQSGESRPEASRRRKIVTIGLMLGMLITAMEGTVVSTAMPTVIGDLHGIKLYPWVFSAYLLTSTSTVPIYGKFADIYGRRRVFLLAASIFLIGSILSGMAHSMPQLIAFRALQGLGAGGVLPLTLTIIGDLYSLVERARVQGLFTSMWGISSLAGPIIGAEITLRLSWRWVFYINLPVGVTAMLLVGCFLKEPATSRSSAGQIDYPGLILMTTAVVSLLTLLLQLGSGNGGLTATTLALLALTVLLIVGFLLQERRAADPMLPLTLFNNRIIAAATIGNVLIGMMMYSVDTYMPLFMQGVRGGTARSASFVLTPLILCWSISAFIGAKLLVRFGFRTVATFGVTSILLAALSLACITAKSSLFVIIPTMIVLGTGLGPSSMTFLVSAQNAVDWKQRGVVTASSQFFRSISGAIGVGALGAVLSARMSAVSGAVKGLHITPNALLNPSERASIPHGLLHAAQGALATGLHWVFMLMALTALICWSQVIRIARGPLFASGSKQGQVPHSVVTNRAQEEDVTLVCEEALPVPAME